MGLSNAVASSAVRHAHVLLVEVPGHWRIRVAVERGVLARGWWLALSPADADVLVVCGPVGQSLGEAIGQVWQQIPGPRVRVAVDAAEDVGERLDEARAGLLDTEHHRHDAHTRPAVAELLPDGDEMDHGGGHEEMHGGHGDMEMSPGGVPLAEGGEDRDGLELDVLHLRLGPVLPYWPAGLLLRCTVQGDVISEAEAGALDPEVWPRPEGGAGAGPVRTLDNVRSLVALAGWDDAAAEARRLRDAMLDGEYAATTGARVRRLRRRVARSRILRWSLHGIGPLGPGDLEELDLPARLTGDTHTRLLAMLDRAAEGEGATPAFPVDRLPHLVTGLDLATARLMVASLDLHDLQPGRADHEVPHA